MSNKGQNQSVVLSVSLKKGCYRHLKVSEGSTLEELANGILWTFEFFNDHAHAFFMDDKAWSQVDCYYLAEVDEDEEYRHTCDYCVGQLKLQKGDKFKFVFDFGEEWTFQCKVLRLEKLGEDDRDIELIKEVGDPPEQYPEYENYEDYKD